MCANRSGARNGGGPTPPPATFPQGFPPGLRKPRATFPLVANARVYVVEDEPDLAEVLQFIRERSGAWFDPDLVPLVEDLYWQGDIFTAAGVQTQLPVEEPTIVLPRNAAEESLLEVARSDSHLGSSGRP